MTTPGMEPIWQSEGYPQLSQIASISGVLKLSLKKEDKKLQRENAM